MSPAHVKVLAAMQLARRVKGKLRAPLPLFRILHRREEKFECPICGYTGPFASFDSFAGARKFAICPKCDGLERHRLQYLVLTREVLGSLVGPEAKTLHFAPEPFFRRIFSERCARYETADLCMPRVDHKADITRLPFDDASYDFVFASHVLEHVSDDRQAIHEIRRVLRPGGIAVLPVPVVSEKTIEYGAPIALEGGHVRAPGVDYFEKYKEFFGRVDVYSSESFPQKYQTLVYEDRTRWPNAECPLRPPMSGEKHLDFVPVCRV
jgi:SAM-dependent methyltransferase